MKAPIKSMAIIIEALAAAPNWINGFLIESAEALFELLRRPLPD